MERYLACEADRGGHLWSLPRLVSPDIGQGRVRGGRLGNRLGLNRETVLYDIDSGGRFSKVEMRPAAAG